MITAQQIRAARAMAGLTLQQLADAAALDAARIEAIEAGREAAGGDALQSLRTALESRGIQFIDSGSNESGGAGVRLKQTHSDDGTRPEDLNATNDD